MRCPVGVNLLREGLDLPEVSLVAILDATRKASCAASARYCQPPAELARNAVGLVILYADKITTLMQAVLDTTNHSASSMIQKGKWHRPGIGLQSLVDILNSTSVADIQTQRASRIEALETKNYGNGRAAL
jgi:excinuclease ABC subunit B